MPWQIWKKVLVAQSCPTLCDPMDCSPPDSPVHGIILARTLECVAISFYRGSSRPRQTSLAMCPTVFLITRSLLAVLELIPASGFPQIQEGGAPSPVPQNKCSLLQLQHQLLQNTIYPHQMWHVFPSLVIGLGIGCVGTWTMNEAKREI